MHTEGGELALFCVSLMLYPSERDHSIYLKFIFILQIGSIGKKKCKDGYKLF